MILKQSKSKALGETGTTVQEYQETDWRASCGHWLGLCCWFSLGGGGRDLDKVLTVRSLFCN